MVYDLGFALTISAFIILIVALIFYFLDSVVHSWLIWVIIFLVFLFLAGILLIFLSPVDLSDLTEIEVV